jgi:hypothetical protein
MIGRGVIVRRGIRGMALHVVAGDRAAKDESGHRPLVWSAVRRAIPENYVVPRRRDIPFVHWETQYRLDGTACAAPSHQRLDVRGGAREGWDAGGAWRQAGSGVIATVT